MAEIDLGEKNMKFGDQVIFTENGIEYPATVLSSRILDFHTGSNDEPLIALGFFKEIQGIIGTARESELVNIRHDVAHESHEFNDAANAVGLKGTYAGGRWREVSPVAEVPAVPKVGGEGSGIVLGAKDSHGVQ
jgi:hypothetical protein